MKRPIKRRESENKSAYSDMAHAKSKTKALKKKKSFIDELEEHKRIGASFDNGTWKPKKKGQSFIEALEEHKGDSRFW